MQCGVQERDEAPGADAPEKLLSYGSRQGAIDRHEEGEEQLKRQTKVQTTLFVRFRVRKCMFPFKSLVNSKVFELMVGCLGRGGFDPELVWTLTKTG